MPEEEPGEQRPAARRAEPQVAGAPGDQRGDGEGERDGEPDVAQVEARRVDHHPVVLELRVEADPVGDAAGRCANGGSMKFSRIRKNSIVRPITAVAQGISARFLCGWSRA